MGIFTSFKEEKGYIISTFHVKRLVITTILLIILISASISLITSPFTKIAAAIIVFGFIIFVTIESVKNKWPMSTALRSYKEIEIIRVNRYTYKYRIEK